MARFTNYATLSYSGGTTDSNTVTGELLETLSVSKTAVSDVYISGGGVTYVLSLVNSGTAALSNLTVTDDLGGYTVNDGLVYPLSYTAGTVRYYANGVLQTTPTVTAGSPLVVSGISVPAGGNAILVYETTVTGYAPLGTEAEITNTATVSGDALSAAVTASASVGRVARAELTISKAISPSSVTENGQLTYTFTIENAGSVAAEAGDQVVMTDTFAPILKSITVTFNGTTWTEGQQYNYSEQTGVFTTTAGQITVPAATYTQNTDGLWTVDPGVVTLVISGTV